FDYCFRDLYELGCCLSCANFQLLDKLADICKNIRNLRIFFKYTYNNKSDYSLSRLIKKQNQIKRLYINSAYGENSILSENFKGAILTHSNSLIDYESHGEHNLDPLLPRFQNLKSLTLRYCGTRKRNLKSILLPNLQEVCLDIGYQLFLPDFMKNNGENLKSLTIYGETSDEYLRETIDSIGKYCQHLRQLSI